MCLGLGSSRVFGTQRDIVVRELGGKTAGTAAKVFVSVCEIIG